MPPPAQMPEPAQSKVLLFGAAAVLRLLLFVGFPTLPNTLAGRVEVSTPVASFKRCLPPICSHHASTLARLTSHVVQEGVFLYSRNVSPYDGGVYHQAPLLLPLFALLPSPASWPIATDLLFVAVDLLAANALAQVAHSGYASTTRLFTSSRKHLRWSDAAVAAG